MRWLDRLRGVPGLGTVLALLGALAAGFWALIHRAQVDARAEEHDRQVRAELEARALRARDEAMLAARRAERSKDLALELEASKRMVADGEAHPPTRAKVALGEAELAWERAIKGLEDEHP